MSTEPFSFPGKYRTPQVDRRWGIWGIVKMMVPFWVPIINNTGPNTGPKLGDPKRDHNFDNP